MDYSNACCSEQPILNITNAERIRLMTDEDLAVLFAKLKVKPDVLERGVQSYAGKDANKWYDWLMQRQ